MKSRVGVKTGFTLIELLVVIAIIGILSALLLPVFSRVKIRARAMQCVSNLKQDGTAIFVYAQDNNDSLPGPCEYGQRCLYFNSTAVNGRFNTELAFHLANYLGAIDPSRMSSTETNFVTTLFCPGYGQFSKELPFVAMTRITYLASFPYNNGTVKLTINPFGYAGIGPAQAFGVNPVKLGFISQYGPITDVFAISDVDSQIYNGNWPSEAAAPSHGKIRNALYFDGHVKAYQGTNFLGVY